MRKFPLLLPFLLLALFSCHKTDPPVQVVKDPNYVKAKSFLYRQNDSAFYYFNKVATAGAKDSLQNAFAYNYMALIQSDAGDIFGAQESLSLALKFLAPAKKSNQRCLASTYNELGLTSLSLKNYAAAITYFEQAKKFTIGTSARLVLGNNLALAYQEKGVYKPALTLYQTLIAQAAQPEIYARILTNLAATRWLMDSGYHAVPALLKALAIRQKEKDRWGESASFAHLSDYYALRRLDSAFFYASKMYAVALELNSPDDESHALKKMIETGPLKATRGYFKRYQQLNDSLQTARNAAKNQFALIRYESEKNKADKLKYQKENSEKAAQLYEERVIRYSSISLFVLIIITTTYLYRKRRQRIEYDAKQREFHLSQKVHDEVANGLYRVMKQIEYSDASGREVLLDEIAELYEQSRDISYEKPDAQAEFEVKIDKLLTNLAGSEIKLATAGNNASLWEEVNTPLRRQLLYILQELMVNMRKHSGATSVSLRFKFLTNQLHIQYIDNGRGFPQEVRLGNGLKNTVSRIERLGGTITFDSSTEKGAKTLIVLPV